MSAAAATASVRRLPGITVAAPPDETDDLLPRMDVAGFVGFAATGPVDVPVAITDPARFAEVFGHPVDLFRDPATGQAVRPYLADAVAAFFATGGRRCWVVRVTARQSVPPFASCAERARFDLGLMTPDSLGTLVRAPLLARSVGGWAEQVKAGIVTLPTPLVVADVQIGPPSAAGATVRLRLQAGVLAPFDLVELRQGTGRFLFAVTAVEDGTVTGGAGLWTEGAGPAPGAFEARLLTVELRASGGGRSISLTGLGCVPGHARYLGDLLTDEELARPLIRDDPRPIRRTALQEEAWKAGFPLASPRPATGMATIFYPADAAPGTPPTVTADSDLPPSATSLDREGLAEFSTALFIDPRLDGVGVRTVQATVEQLRDVQGQQLVGLHALLAVDEVSLLCLPDAVHRRWSRPEPPPPETYYQPSQPPFPPPLPGPPPHETYSRPRECGHDDPQSWHDVTSPTLEPPTLSSVVTANRLLQLTWTAAAGASFILEESTTPWTWAGAEEVYRGQENSLDLYGRTPGRYLYRLRAETDEAASDWSPALVVDLPDLAFVTTAPADLGALMDVQVTAMTACAGRGDLLAVLAGPAGQDARDAAAHAEALRGRAADDRLLSFGALYHPWTVTVAGALVPPDGAATGLLAAVAAERGCWREPANIPLAGVVALVPIPGHGDADAAEDAGTNLVQPQPHGLVTLAAATLSGDADLGRIAVRRLLSLLRRLALRDGPGFVFEPQSEVLRRHVRRHFEAMLGQLMTRGAFVGPGPAQSFQVVVSGTVPEQLAVDLKVAPAAALHFLTVRLVGAGNGVAVIEEV